MRKTGTAVVFVAGLLLGPAAPAAEPTAAEVAARLQALYERTEDFKAAFRQVYHSRALGRDKVSSGYVYVKKPGLMRWDYREPRPKHFVADGKALYIYDPDLGQVMVDRSFSDADLSTAVTFLWGRGKLAEEFDIRFADSGGDAEHHRLELTPRSQARFRKLWFSVARASGLVDETVVEDPGGNTNTITFSKLETNVGLKVEAFRFEVPEGVEVIEAPEK